MDIPIFKKYNYEKDNIIYKITLFKVLSEDFFSINCQTSYNISYFIKKNLQELSYEYKWVQNYCKSTGDLFTLIDLFFNLSNVFINGRNNSELNLGIFLNLENYIIFSLKSCSINDMNNIGFNYPLNSNQNNHNNQNMFINRYNNNNLVLVNINENNKANGLNNCNDYFIVNNNINNNNNKCQGNNNFNIFLC